MTLYHQWQMRAEQVACQTGVLLRERWQTTHTVYSKGFRDVVTDADLAAEQLILGQLRETYPDHGFTSEEAGAELHAGQVRWFIDPVDGTTNFSRNNPNFCLSIAATVGELPVVGVIYDPLREHLFSARQGGGATLNGAPLQTSGITELAEAMVAMDWPRDPEQRVAAWQRAGELLERARTLRCLGSAALNMAYVAAGWFDMYVAQHLSPWDQAAAALLVQEAGGGLGTCSGAPWTLAAPDPVLAATPALLAAFRALEGKRNT